MQLYITTYIHVNEGVNKYVDMIKVDLKRLNFISLKCFLVVRAVWAQFPFNVRARCGRKFLLSSLNGVY